VSSKTAKAIKRNPVSKKKKKKKKKRKEKKTKNKRQTKTKNQKQNLSQNLISGFACGYPAASKNKQDMTCFFIVI
jgi:F0F1-type ATP synthase assembly protein I